MQINPNYPVFVEGWNGVYKLNAPPTNPTKPLPAPEPAARITLYPVIEIRVPALSAA